MRVVIINKSDSIGGAAVVSRRLMHALRAEGVDARMLVTDRRTDDEFVELAVPRWRSRIPFLLERLNVFAANGFDRRDLFKVDPASHGLPLRRHPLVESADVVMLNWVNQGMLSLRGVAEIAAEKPVIWTMHDLWNVTGICHHPGKCGRFREECGECPFLHRNASPRDLSHRTYQQKKALYARHRMQFVAVSHWLAERCRESSLLGDAEVEVIPNAFPTVETPMIYRDAGSSGPFRAVVAAARLDDEVKGFPILLKALRRLSETHSDIAQHLHLTFCGDIRNPDLLDQVCVSHEWTGRVPEARMHEIMRNADMVISSSLYETLPGTLVEGQAQGAWPVTFDRGGQRDIVTDGVTGSLAMFGESEDEAAENLAQAILRGITSIQTSDNKELKHRLRENVTQRFSAPEVARRYISLLEKSLRQK